MALIATGEWEVASDTDWFSADLIAGQSYVVELIGPDGYVFRIYDDAFAPFDGFFDGGAYSGSIASNGHFTAGESGTFHFSATGLAPGSYQIRLTEIADDFDDNANSDGVVVSGVARGRAEAVGDSDWFGATLTAGQAYAIGVASPGAFEIRVVDAEGNLVELPQPGANGKIVWVPEVSGHYEIVVVASGTGAPFAPANYTLSVDPVAHVDDWGHIPGDTGAITVGGSATGNWELLGDKDWFAVTLNANQTYSIKASGAGISNAFAGSLTVVDANGVPVALPGGLATGSNNGISFTPATSGTYYVQMQSADGKGAYGVSVTQIADDFTNSAVRPGTVTVGGSATGVFEANNDGDWFRVDLVAGQSYSTSVLPQNSRDWFGYATFAGTDGLPHGQTFTATTTGSYWVELIGLTDAAAPKSGAYTLGVASYRDDFADNAATAGRITIGGQATGNTEIALDEDWFKVTLEAGKSYEFVAEGMIPQLSPFVYVYDANGAILSADGAFTAQTGGVYYIAVTGFFASNYTLKAIEYADDFGEPLPETGLFFDVPGYDGNGVVKAGTASGETLTGATRDDLLQGFAGDDKLSGKGGDDYLDGGTGKDRMTGGAGDDSYVVDQKGDKVIELAGEGYDRVFSAIGYTLEDEIEALTLTGAANLSGTGNSANNAIVGNVGANKLDGGVGDDTIDGGAGLDSLKGGAGVDRFVFDDGDTGATAATADKVLDFSHAAGDVLDLVAVDAREGLTGDQGFAFLSTGRFSGNAGELRYVFAGGDTLIQGDTDGDRIADFVIRVIGEHALMATDFQL